MDPTTKHFGSTSNRRAFLGRGMTFGMGTVGAAVLGGALQFEDAAASGEITDGDAAILRWLAAAELVEADLWNQYAVMARDNADFQAALTNVDDSSPRYALDTTDDENSHHMLINACLKANGKQEVTFDRFRTIASPLPAGKGGTKTPNLTNLTNLTVDTSWWARYRSDQNPDLGATFPQLVTIKNRPAIPPQDGITGDAMQAIAAVALFHFVTIEQGGASLYPTLALHVSNADVLRILVSIGPVEAFHFATFEGSLESLPPLDVPATATSPAMHFPDLKNNHTETPDNLDAAGVMPDPCTFLRQDLPQCSVVRPTSMERAGAGAAARAFIDSGVFTGQPQAFINQLLDLATAADRAWWSGNE